MKTFNLLSILIAVVTSGCITKKGVNDTQHTTSLSYIAAATMAGLRVDPSATPGPAAGIEGKLLLQGTFPTPLVHIELGLFKKTDNGRWEELTRLSTEPGGVFSFTRVLPAGNYEVRILDKRYFGVMPVTLTDAPRREIFFYAEKIKE